MTKHPRAHQTSEPASATPETDDVRERIVRARDTAIEALRRIGVSPAEEMGPRGATLDEGDQAQASERQDMGMAYRERLADRINRLTRALEMLTRGTYGVCEECNEKIPPRRLEAFLAARLCIKCQSRAEKMQRS